MPSAASCSVTTSLYESVRIFRARDCCPFSLNSRPDSSEPARWSDCRNDVVSGSRTMASERRRIAWVAESPPRFLT